MEKPHLDILTKITSNQIKNKCIGHTQKQLLFGRETYLSKTCLFATHQM